MTLYDLKNTIDFTFDITDDEVDASFYIELDEINDDLAAQIEVVKISRDLVTCKLSRFLQRLANFHPTEITNFIDDRYYDGDQKDYLVKQLTRRPSHTNKFKADVTDDGGEAVYHFITNDMYDFLTK